MANTEIVIGTLQASPYALARTVLRPIPPTGIALLISETLADLSYDATRAACNREIVERACEGDRLSQRYMLHMVPDGQPVAGFDVGDSEIDAILAMIGD